jgi:hypothetical protein
VNCTETAAVACDDRDKDRAAGAIRQIGSTQPSRAGLRQRFEFGVSEHPQSNRRVADHGLTVHRELLHTALPEPSWRNRRAQTAIGSAHKDVIRWRRAN